MSTVSTYEHVRRCHLNDEMMSVMKHEHGQICMWGNFLKCARVRKMLVLKLHRKCVAILHFYMQAYLISQNKPHCWTFTSVLFLHTFDIHWTNTANQPNFEMIWAYEKLVTSGHILVPILWAPRSSVLPFGTSTTAQDTVCMMCTEHLCGNDKLNSRLSACKYIARQPVNYQFLTIFLESKIKEMSPSSKPKLTEKWSMRPEEPNDNKWWS